MDNLRKKIKSSMFAMALLFGVLLLPSPSTFAVGASNHFSVGPMNQKIILTPGEVFNGSIKVTNPATSEAPLYYSATPTPYSVTGENYNIGFESSSYTQMSGWMTIVEPEGIIEPNSTKEIHFEINVPMDAPAGGQYAAIRVKNDKNKFIENTKRNSVNITEDIEIVSIVYASVAGNTLETGEILENSIPSFVFASPLTVSSLVENTGNVHDDAEYTLQVYPLLSNEEFYTNEENPLIKLIMPDTKRTVVQTWDETPMVGIFNVKQTVKLFDKTSVTEKLVIICPVWLLIVIVFVIALVIIWLFAKAKARNKANK